MNRRKFKSYDQAKQVGEAMKKEIGFINFGAKSIKEVGTGNQAKIEIEGYASTKDRDRYGDIVEPTAFEKTIDGYMSNPMLLLQHDPNKQIGVITGASIDGNGLYIKGDVKYKAGDEELFDKITNGDLKGFSIGFRIKELELLEEDDGNGGTMWTWLIKELELLEISVVTIPANPYTLMKSIDDLFKKSLEGTTPEVDGSETTETDPEGNQENETPSDQVEEETPEAPSDDTPEVKENGESEEQGGDPEGGENPEFDNGDEGDKITESKSDEPEKQDETPASSEKPTGDDEKEKEASFTLKMIDKIIGAKTEAMEKQFQAKEKQLREDLQKEFDEKIKAFETENVKVLEGLYEIMKSHGDQIKAVAEGTKNLTSGKGFIYAEVKPKDEAEGRDKQILAKFQAMKQIS